MSLILQPRDLKLLAVISRYGAISTNQVYAWFFAGVAKTTVLRRIRLLAKDHYIKRGMTLSNGENSFYLGPKGRKTLNIESSNPLFNRNTIEHDILLNSIRWRLESFGLAKDVTPEWEMRSEVFRNYHQQNAKEKLIPDLLMIESLQSEALAISVELELTIKSKLRYKKILEQYAFKDGVSKIWYFCRSNNDATKILRASHGVYHKITDKLWFTEVNEFFKLDDPIVWSAKTKKQYRLSELGFKNFKKPAYPHTQGVSTESKKDRAGVDSDKSLESQTNSLILSTPEAPYPDTDHSPPTRGSGQYRDMEVEKDKISELDDMELDKCG